MRLKIDLSDLAEELKNDIGNAIKGKVADEIEKIYRQAVQSIVYGRSASAYYSRTNGFLNSVSVGNPVFDGSSAMVEVGIDTESLVPNFNGNGVFNNYMGFDGTPFTEQLPVRLQQTHGDFQAEAFANIESAVAIELASALSKKWTVAVL